MHLSHHKGCHSPQCCSDSDNIPIVFCRYETLTALLESNELGTVSEFNVFLAAMRWVDADESREHFLDEVLRLVRFPTMDYEELGLVGKHPTAAGAAILKVCPMPLLAQQQVLCWSSADNNESLDWFSRSGTLESHSRSGTLESAPEVSMKW